MLKKIIFVLLLSFVFLFSQSKIVVAATVDAYLFYGEGCPHCAKESQFLNQLVNKYPELKLHEYEIYYNTKNNQLLQKVANELGANAGGVPFLVIGDQSYVGFSESLSPKEIENRVKQCIDNDCQDVVADLQGRVNEVQIEKIAPTEVAKEETKDQTETENKTIDLPILGQVDTSQLSLPVLTIVLAFIDGFNPCAMWTLLFLISLLLGLKDKKRMWALGVAFIVSSASVYFLFLTAWLNLFMFLGFVVWIRVLIGGVALLAAYHYLKDYFVNKKGGCNVMGDEKRQKIFAKLRQITEKKQFVLALGGIVLLAIAVNMVELICSAGLPAIYTQILSLADLTAWQYYLYLALYILVFMLDDLFIFFTAMITLQAVGVQGKYARYSHLIGGILMAVIGLLLLFKPEWLMFG